MKLSRRDLMIAAGAAVIAAAGTAATGLTAYSIRKASWKPKAAPQSVSDGGWVLSQQDMAELESLDAVPRSETFEFRENVDFLGGDLEAIRVDGLGACVEACEANRQCKAFTYAKTNHPQSFKKMMCWLKDAEGTSRSDISYVSGVRR